MIGNDGKLINKEVRLENTNLCNAHCVMCPRDQMTRAKTTMEYAGFCNIVDQCAELGARTVSVFGYGEPLLDTGVAAKVDYCSARGLNTWITTNASLLSQQMSFNLIHAGLENIRFSIHAISLYHYDRIHRVLIWMSTLKNIATFLEINESLGRLVTTHVTMIPTNDETVEQIVDTWVKHVDYLEVWRPHNWGGKKQYRESDPKKNTCGRPFNGPVQIQADGDVIPCCFLTNAEIVLGNVFDDSLADILKGKKYATLRAMHLSGNHLDTPCNTCDQRNIEVERPLLYSNRDPSRVVGKTSTTKFNVEEL